MTSLLSRIEIELLLLTLSLSGLEHGAYVIHCRTRAAALARLFSYTLWGHPAESGELSLLVSSNEVEERGLEGQREGRG
jgi:hypothetical protein